MISPSKGTLLIANPFLKDPNFSRTVVFLCEHNADGSFGFVLNKTFPVPLQELLPDMDSGDFPVSQGGPVRLDSLHFLHQYPDMIGGGERVLPGVYWGGNYESLKSHILQNELQSGRIRFFVGYSGWSEGQLENEMKEESWLTVKATRELIFETRPEDVWKSALKHLGGDYEMMINFPIDPQLN
ncbi:MAG: YqgE/AlgH family protein [Bacteroidota bacterium]|nr:YqgE/AlgH family protein [Bacteroidota bacterium]